MCVCCGEILLPRAYDWRYGSRPDPSKLAAVERFPVPGSVTKIKSFAGLCSYFRRYVMDFAIIAEPLVRLTRKEVEFRWSEKQNVAFETLKHCLINSPVLAHYDPCAAIELHTDASMRGIGAWLITRTEHEEHVVGYASRLLNVGGNALFDHWARVPGSGMGHQEV